MIIPPSSHTNLAGHFLIASPLISEAPYQQATILVIQHNNRDGAFGLLLNQADSKINFNDICVSLNLENQISETDTPPVFFGGDNHPKHVVVLHQPTKKAYRRTNMLTKDIQATSSEDIMVDLAAGTGPKDPMIFLGYVEWSPHSLEYEILKDYWLCSPLDPGLIFEHPDWQPKALWKHAGQLMGINLIPNLSLESGNC